MGERTQPSSEQTIGSIPRAVMGEFALTLFAIRTGMDPMRALDTGVLIAIPEAVLPMDHDPQTDSCRDYEAPRIEE